MSPRLPTVSVPLVRVREKCEGNSLGTGRHGRRHRYNIKGGVDTVIPVDVYVPGCAARPQAIIDGVVKALEILEQKREAYVGKKANAGRA